MTPLVHQAATHSSKMAEFMDEEVEVASSSEEDEGSDVDELDDLMGGAPKKSKAPKKPKPKKKKAKIMDSDDEEEGECRNCLS